MLVRCLIYERVAFIAINTVAESLGYITSLVTILQPESIQFALFATGNYHRRQNLLICLQCGPALRLKLNFN